MILLLILPIIALVLVIYSFYWFAKEFFNSRKVGIRVAQVLILIVIGYFSYFIFQRECVFFKSNIIKTLNENQLDLHYDFIKVNSHSPGFLIANTEFTLEIDTKDRLNLIRNIKSSPNFRKNIPKNYYFEWEEVENQKINKIIIDSETTTEVIREIYLRNPDVRTIIAISKNTNKLIYEKE